MSVSFRTYGKMVFFDRSVIRRNWKNINESPLKKAGLLVRRIARGSIKRVKKRHGKPSPVGKPPRSRRPGKTPPFKMIYSVPNVLGTSVMVGMVWFGSFPPVPGLHEHGGFTTRKVPVLVGFKGGNKPKPVFSFVSRRAKYPARPFMYPALQKGVPRIPLLWRHSLSAA